MMQYFNLADFVITVIVAYGFTEMFHKFFDCFAHKDKEYPISYELVILLLVVVATIGVRLFQEVFG